jgi:acyl carrier protein
MEAAMPLPTPTPSGVPNCCPFCGVLLADPPERSSHTACVSCGVRLWFTRSPSGTWFHDPVRVAPIRERVIRVVCENLGVNPEKITDATSFTEDIRADTLDLVEMVMELETEFGMTIADPDAERMITVGDVVSYFVRHSEGIVR